MLNDERLTNVEANKQTALAEGNKLYDGLMQDNQNLYNTQLETLNKQEQMQNATLDKQLEFQRNEIEKQKQQAQKTYEAESAKARNDYTSFVNPYGQQAESMAQSGLLNSGMSETSKLGGFNTYQNRLATANKVMQDAFTTYDKNLNEAILNNDVQKAQNALNKLELQLGYLESYYSNQSTIKQNQYSNSQTIDNNFYNRYQDVINQINYEKEQEEARKQYEEQFTYQKEQDALNFNYQKEQDALALAFQKEQAALAQSNWEKEYALSKAATKSSGGSGSTSGAGGNYDLSGNDEKFSEENNTASNGLKIIANPYTDKVHPDAIYGVFNTGNGSGYQPNNVGGVTLSNSGKKVKDVYSEAINSNGKDMSNQKIWEANGKYYVWDGSAGDYVDITDDYNRKLVKKLQASIYW